MVEQLGIEEVVRDFRFIERVLRNKGQYLNSYLNGRSFL